MEWSEVDLQSAVWTVPDAHVKDEKNAVRGLRVPLSARAVEILRSIPRSGDAIFGEADRHILRETLLKLGDWRERATGRRITVHGFRSSFSTWVAETTSFTREIRETALGHDFGGDVEGAYQRGDLLAKRRRLMDAWGDYCGGISKTRKLRVAS
jgi:integrase